MTKQWNGVVKVKLNERQLTLRIKIVKQGLTARFYQQQNAADNVETNEENMTGHLRENESKFYLM